MLRSEAGQGPVEAAGTCLVACFHPAWSRVTLGSPGEQFNGQWTLDHFIPLPQFSIVTFSTSCPSGI